ncbi:MAG: hypothetical protein J5I50_06265 [Chitinophagaceae bacterium]|nr:hypothetical protein [Chitinophagaceae bacterium]
MDYKKIILEGLFAGGSKHLLSRYFWQQSERWPVDKVTFFSKCVNVCDELEAEFTGQFNDVHVRFDDQIEMAEKRGMVKAVARIEKQAAYITQDNFRMQLAEGRTLSMDEINLARWALHAAIEKAKSELSEKIDEVETVRKTRTKLSNNDDPWLLVADQSKKDIVAMYEKNLEQYQVANIIDAWIQGNDVELCAAFCNHLLEEGFFIDRKINTAISFAHGRYGCNIKATLDKIRRKKQSNLLKEKTNEIIRIATNQKYGLVRKRIRQK